MAMYLLSHLFRIDMIRCGDVASLFASEGESAFWSRVSEFTVKPIIIDDLGAEREARSYGNAPPITDWLMKRYNSWQMGGAKTHLTTNLSESEMQERYGIRILDRIYEMSSLHVIKGKNWRRTKETK